MNPEILEKLAKLESLFERAGTFGEKSAAEAAINRLKEKVKNDEVKEEIQFSLGDVWSVKLFIAVCKKYGLRPYRYPRQRRTTLVLKEKNLLSMK